MPKIGATTFLTHSVYAAQIGMSEQMVIKLNTSSVRNLYAIACGTAFNINNSFFYISNKSLGRLTRKTMIEFNDYFS